jgi:hypothetical protein
MSAAVPGAWYDLAVRISQARAVVCCIHGALPEVEPDMVRRHCLERAIDLAGAVDDLLMLAAQDVERLEKQFEQAG